MYIPTRSVAIVISTPMTAESLLKDIAEAVLLLANELDEHDTGRSITVCMENPVELKNVQFNGMYVSTIGPDERYSANTVHLGHGVDNFESFRIPPGGVIDLED